MTGIGYCACIVICKKEDLPHYFVLALSSLLGAGVISCTIFILAIFNVRFDFFIPLLALLPFCAYAVMSKKPNDGLRINLSFLKNLTLLEKFLILLVSLRLIYIFSQSLLIPVYSWDAFATWAYRAKAFYLSGAFDFSAGVESYPHASYPNLIPLLECWLYNGMGTLDDRLVKIIFPLFFVSFLLVAYYFLRRLTSRKYSLTGIYLVTAMPFLIYHSTISYADLPLMVYSTSAIMMLVLWMRENKGSYLVIGGLLAGFGAFTKLEGIAYAGIISILFLAYIMKSRSKFKPFLKFLIPLSVIVLLHIAFVKAMNLSTERMCIDFTLSNISRIPYILKTFFYSLFIWGNWNIMWALLIFAILFNIKGIQRERLTFIIGAILSYLVLYLAIFIFTSDFKHLISGSVLNRLFLHFTPLAVLLIIGTTLDKGDVSP